MTDEPDDLRALLGDVPAPDPTARERALAAAMAVFEQQQAPRRRSTRWLTPVAAGLVGVVAIGGAIALILPRTDEDRVAQTADADLLRTEAATTGEAETADEAEAAEAAEDVAMAAPTMAAAPAMAESSSQSGSGSPAAPGSDESRASSASPPLTARTDADLVAAARTARSIEGSSECGVAIVAEVLDRRDPTTSRPVLLTIETADDGEFLVVLAPEGTPDACTELDRLPLP